MGKFTPSWGNYTVPPSEPWDPNPHPTITQETDKESEEEPTYLHRECSLCSTPLATFNAFEPLTCYACTNTLQTDTDNQITKALTHEEREDEEEFQFKGISIAGESEGDSEESWERESWDTGDDRETGKDSSTNNLQWANWDTSDKTKQGEELPWFPHPRTVHILATEDIAFSVGPRKDGIVKFTTTIPFVLTTNYYQLLADDTLIYPPVPTPFVPTTARRTWFSTRADELHHLVEKQMVTPVTNAQRLAHPWKTAKQETNRKNKATLDRIIDAYVQYINDSAALVPPTLTHTHCWKGTVPETPRARPIPKPTLYLCMNQPHDPRTTTTPPNTPPDQPIKRKEPWKPTFQTIPGTLDPPSPRTGNKKQRISRAYLQLLLKARTRGRISHVPSTAHTNTASNTQLSAPATHKIPTKAPHKGALHTTKDPSSDSDSDQSTDLYYRAQANHRPEMRESNAESVLREEQITQDVKRMRRERKSRQKQTQEKQHRPSIHNHVTDVTLQTDYSLYENPETYSTTQPIPLIYDTGAAISMLSSEPSWAWTNLRDCMFNLGGCFTGPTVQNLQMGEYHGVMTLDSGETVRTIIPEAVQVPAKLSHSNLLANTPYLMAGHKFQSDLHKPKLKFKGGGQYTLAVTKGHNLLCILPINATKESTHRAIYLHLDQPYDPPTFLHETHYQTMNRANRHTPTAFIWHLRYACKSANVLKHSQGHVNGMSVQMGSWGHLQQLLPCSACLAGKMKKTRKTPKTRYTDMTNLAVSWQPGTDNKISTPNELVSLDWGIINKKNQANVNNVFALYLDNHTGLVFFYHSR
jgi:hypothetical protein